MKFNLKSYKYDVRGNKEEKNPEPQLNCEDYVVKSMGAFGRWQAISYTIISLSRLIAMWNMLSLLFLTPDTKFVCKRFKDNSSMKNESSTCYQDCLEYEFSSNIFDKTLISEFNLICDKAWMAHFAQTVLMFGVVVGVAVFGWISDGFGRSRAIIVSASVSVIFMIAAPFAPSYWIFITLRFFIGVASGGIMSITAVYILEVVGPQHRELAVTLVLVPDDIAESSLALFAYLATSWQVFLLEYGIISVVILILLFFLPETPRWLMANGKAAKAVDLMTKAAKCNSRSTANIKDNVDKSLRELNLTENDSNPFNYFSLFKTKEISIITLASLTMWFITGLCYFGISQYNTGLDCNIYIIVAIMGLIQIPMAPLATVLTKVYGRKISTIGSYIVTGVAMIVLLVAGESSVSTVFGIIGILSTGVNFCVIYLYVVELYPTRIRNMGFSVSSLWSKLGAMLAPFVASIKPRWIPSLIFAILPFAAGAICLLLPETKGRKLRDTVDK